MAKRKVKYLGLPRDTKIEMIAIHPVHGTHKKEMTYGQALNFKKKKGWKYINYQLGHSQFNLSK